ncbi:hypothetical protein FACS1894127_0270 [Clostridia bacterium]|nr:hypothetical protein FACS1894127_0270 [Clostridia bacterium]
MKISYSVTGKERKALVTAISEIKDEPLEYKGAPTFAYEIGWWRVDKNGTVENTAPATRPCAEEIISGLAERGFTAAYIDWAEFEDEAEAYADHEMKRLKLENENVPDHSNRGQYEGDDISEANHLTLEFPLEGFTPEAIENLTKMVAAKQAILKAALGTEILEIQQDGDTLKFPWFTLESPGEAAYYVQFVWALCTAAKEKKRITAKERGVVDNPKYAMRCWLLSLGLIGDEYKAARKLLLSKLDGNSAFKSGAPKKAEEADDEK